jgi:ribosomal protein S1
MLIKNIRAEGFTGEKKEFVRDPWPELYEALRTGEILQGRVLGMVEKDGKTLFQVDLGSSIRGLIPEDEMDPGKASNISFVGSVVAFKVKHCDRGAGVVYLSRKEAVDEMEERTWAALQRDGAEVIALWPEIKAVLEELNAAREKGDMEGTRAAQAKLAELIRKGKEAGPVRTCSVRAVVAEGAYVDIGGVTAWLPRREISHAAVSDARELIQPGDSFDVKVYQINPDDRYVVVSLRAMLPDPWENIAQKYFEGGLYVGKVAREVARGLLVELEPGLLCRVNMSTLGAPPIGSEVVVGIEKIDPEKRRIWAYLARVRRRAAV